jgi:hypothetical protein
MMAVVKLLTCDKVITGRRSRFEACDVARNIGLSTPHVGSIDSQGHMHGGERLGKFAYYHWPRYETGTDMKCKS